MLSAPSLCDEMDWMSSRPGSNGTVRRHAPALQRTAFRLRMPPPCSVTITLGSIQTLSTRSARSVSSPWAAPRRVDYW